MTGEVHFSREAYEELIQKPMTAALNAASVKSISVDVDPDGAGNIRVAIFASDQTGGVTLIGEGIFSEAALAIDVCDLILSQAAATSMKATRHRPPPSYLQHDPTKRPRLNKRERGPSGPRASRRRYRG